VLSSFTSHTAAVLLLACSLFLSNAVFLSLLLFLPDIPDSDLVFGASFPLRNFRHLNVESSIVWFWVAGYSEWSAWYWIVGVASVTVAVNVVVRKLGSLVVVGVGM
jgi:hypothetical protein